MPRSDIRYVAAEEYLSMIRRGVTVRSGTETLSLDALAGRILAEDLHSPTDLPPYATSLVDGYAIRAEDTATATQDHPATIKIAGRIELEEIPKIRINPTETRYIPTGGIIPDGADAAVKIEEASVSNDNTSITLTRPIHTGEHVTPAGKDVKKDQLILKKGRKIHSEDLALLAAMKIWRAKAAKKPRIAIISVGDELTDRIEEVTAVKKFNGIALTIANLVAEAGGEPILLGIAPDEQAAIRNKIRQGLDTAEAVVTIGGTSKGIKDFVADAINRSGRPGLIFHGIDIVPGRVSGLGVIEGKPIIMMPGLIQSTAAAFYFIALPAIRRLCGLEPEPHSLRIRVPIGEDLSFATPQFRKLLFVRLVDREGETVAQPLSKLGEAALMKPVADADGFVLISAGSISIREGEPVTVNLLRS